MSGTWLGRLVRARRIQQDLAQQQLADAQRALRVAQHRAAAEHARVGVLADSEYPEMDGPAFVAAVVALQAAAATHSAARFAVGTAETDVDAHRRTLRDAAVAHDSADELQQRFARAARDEAARVEQRDLDEIAAGVHRRSTDQETP